MDVKLINNPLSGEASRQFSHAIQIFSCLQTVETINF